MAVMIILIPVALILYGWLVLYGGTHAKRAPPAMCCITVGRTLYARSSSKWKMCNLLFACLLAPCSLAHLGVRDFICSCFSCVLFRLYPRCFPSIRFAILFSWLLCGELQFLGIEVQQSWGKRRQSEGTPRQEEAGAWCARLKGDVDVQILSISKTGDLETERTQLQEYCWSV